MAARKLLALVAVTAKGEVAAPTRHHDGGNAERGHEGEELLQFIRSNRLQRNPHDSTLGGVGLGRGAERGCSGAPGGGSIVQDQSPVTHL